MTKAFPGGLWVHHNFLLVVFLSQNLERLGHNSGANTLVLVTFNHLWHTVLLIVCVRTYIAHLDWMLPVVNSNWGQQSRQQVSLPCTPPLVPKVVTLDPLWTPCHMSSLLRVCMIFVLGPQQDLPIDVLSYTQPMGWCLAFPGQS